jgi:hypothetical protein
MWRITLCLAACTSAVPPPAAPAIEPSLLAVRDDAFGPLTAQTPATLVALRAALAGFDVAPINAEGLEYRVSHAGTPLFAIVPDERGTILNIHVMSPKLDLGGLRVGMPFTGDTTTCECWGDQTVCFREGAHVAVGLAKICREGTLATASARAKLAGVAITATIWSPRELTPGGYGTPDPEPEP